MDDGSADLRKLGDREVLGPVDLDDVECAVNLRGHVENLVAATTAG